MKRILFKTKEDYLEMKKQWANYFNTEAQNGPMDQYGYRAKKLYAEHFILYAIMRGKDPEKCITTCSEDTRAGIISTLNSQWFYTSIRFKEVFNIDAEQIELIKKQAVKFFTPQPEEIKKEKVPMTDSVLQSCLA